MPKYELLIPLKFFFPADLPKNELLLELVLRPASTPKAEQSDDFRSDFGRHRRAAAVGFAQTFEQTHRRRALEQTTVCARAQSVENLIVVIINRQHQNQHLRIFFFQDFDALNPVHSGQTDVGKHDVRDVHFDPVDSFFHRLIRAGAFKTVGKSDQLSQAFADVVLVFDDRRFYRIIRFRFGHFYNKAFAIAFLKNNRTL